MSIGKDSSNNLTPTPGDIHMGNVALRSVDTVTSKGKATGVPLIVRPRAPEQASSTLKQNAALLERLRQVAMRSDRPPSSAVIEVVPAVVKSVATPEEKTFDDLVIAEAPITAPAPIIGAETARAFLLVNPAVEVPVAPGAVASPPEPRTAREEEEPTTNMQPSVMRAREHAVASSFASATVTASPETTLKEPINAKQRLATPASSSSRRRNPVAFVVTVAVLMIGAGSTAYHFAQVQHPNAGAALQLGPNAMRNP